MKITKKHWMKIHTYLSLFFLPVAFIYVLTGALYIFGINNNTTATSYDFKLDSPPKKGEEQQIIIDTLLANNMKLPSDTNITIIRNQASMGNVAYSAMITKDGKGNDVVRVTERGLCGILIMMHKSTGTKHDMFGLKLTFFDIIAITFSISMLIFYLSGLIVTSFCKKDRKNALMFFSAGFMITALAIWGSL